MCFYHMCLATMIRKWNNESVHLHYVNPYGSIRMLLIPYSIVSYVTFDYVLKRCNMYATLTCFLWSSLMRSKGTLLGKQLDQN